jgi:hypothetical protein
VSLWIWAVLVIGVFVVPIGFFVVDTMTGGDGSPTPTRSRSLTPAEKTSSACDLLSASQIGEVLGGSFDDGVEGGLSAVGTISCTWTSLDAADPQTLTATVGSDQTIEVALGQLAKQLYEGTRDRATVDEALAIADSAYRSGGTVAVLDGRLAYSFTVSIDSPRAVDGLERLAADAVDHGVRGLH